MSAPSAKPTDSELAILQILWHRGPSTVKTVQEDLGEDTGYTTALKFLQLMMEKGLVRRNTEQRAHLYEAACSKEATQRQLLSGFLNRAFSGSTSQLIMQALAAKRATSAELAEIKKLINQLTSEAK